MKYLVVYATRGDEFVEEFDYKEEAFKNADYQWYHLTRSEKRDCKLYVLESVNPDEEAENHMDGDVLREYSLEYEDKPYVIVDERDRTESDRMSIHEVIDYLGEEFDDCNDEFDCNEILDKEKNGEAGYRVEERGAYESKNV